MMERRVSANIYQIFQFSERYCIGVLVWRSFGAGAMLIKPELKQLNANKPSSKPYFHEVTSVCKENLT